MRTGWLRVFLGMLLLTGCAGSPSPPPSPPDAETDGVPPVFRPLYRELESELALLNPVKIDWGGNEGTVFGVELLVANSNRGEDLLEPRVLAATALTLDRFKELGARSVSLSIQYPFLTAAHPKTPELREFYRRVAALARARGFALVVEMGSMFREPEFSRMTVDYGGLTRERFGAGLREMAEAVIAEIRPDYLTILSEPDTQLRNTGLRFSPADFAATVRKVAKDLDRRGARLGAGAGTWSSSDYFKDLAAIVELDYIDLHIYPIQMGFAADRALKAAEIAKARGKRVTIGEAWLYKAAGREFGRIQPVEAYARDVFSFWQPLDVLFIETVVKLARTVQAEFCSFFWMKYLYGYVAYSEKTGRLPPGQLMRLSDEVAAEEIRRGRLSAAGERFRELTAK